jgi:hypothetical protein
MKAKTQIGIGLIAAAFSAASIMIHLVHSWLRPYNISDGFFWFSWSGLFFPIAYGFAVVRKNLKGALRFLLIWSVLWVAACCLLFLELVGIGHSLVQHVLGLAVSYIAVYPTIVFPWLIWDFVTFPFPLVAFSISSVLIIALLWLGVRGLKRLDEGEAD